MDAENPFRLLDWRSLDGYPSDDASMSVWAWEFLRRSPAYQKFWKEKIEPFIETVRFDHLPGETQTIGRNDLGVVWPYHDELKELFGVDVPSSPDSSTPPIFDATWIKHLEKDGREFQSFPLAENEIAYIFDLTRPLKPQFDRIRKHAEKKQAELKAGSVTKRRIDKYVQYLQILDAIEAGEKSQTIADALFSNKLSGYQDNPRLRAFYDARDPALQMRDGGYKAIIG